MSIYKKKIKKKQCQYTGFFQIYDERYQELLKIAVSAIKCVFNTFYNTYLSSGHNVNMTKFSSLDYFCYYFQHRANLSDKSAPLKGNVVSPSMRYSRYKYIDVATALVFFPR